MSLQVFCSAVTQLLLSVLKNVKRIFVSAALVTMFVSSALAAGETIPLQNGRLKVDLASYALVYVDPTAQLTIEELAAPEFESKLTPVEGELVDFGFNTDR
ncbi:MAG: hypothetical protein AAFR27_07475, partial [Pseudomonadota bacterium]